MADEASERLNVPRTFKIGSFYIGSAFPDILTSAIWNRVLISDLGIAAWPVALLSALRYLLSPLSIWAGNRSDTTPIAGRRRLPYIWGGRFLMLIAMLLLPVTTLLLAENMLSPLGWFLAFIAFFLYGLGTLGSSSPYLALIRDRTVPSKRGLALAIGQIMLLISMVIAPGIFAVLMKHYDAAGFWRIVLISVGVSLPFWIFSIAGEDPKVAPAVPLSAVPDAPRERFIDLLRELWGDAPARTFFIFLSLGSMAAFAQDAILEPFGADVFGMDVGETTRFNVFWGLGVLIAMITTTVLNRKRTPGQQRGTVRIGLSVAGIGLLLLGLTGAFQFQALLIPVLFLFGTGVGIYSVGVMAMLMAMTTENRAGAYLGLWTVPQLVFRGIGIALGGLLRDIFLQLSGSHVMAYSTIFFLEAVGMAACILLLARIDVERFGQEQPPLRESPLAMADA
ncbi:MAG: BCD family MFS transporter [Oscillochloris sp.]|nr:BCD family MFS transporter [Oscillochloris sp.]